MNKELTEWVLMAEYPQFSPLVGKKINIKSFNLLGFADGLKDNVSETLSLDNVRHGHGGPPPPVDRLGRHRGVRGHAHDGVGAAGSDHGRPES